METDCFRRIVAAVALALGPTLAGAQPIHGHPQKAAYASAAEYPRISYQGHWPIKGETNALADGCDPDVAVRCAHLHSEMAGPLYAEAAPGDVLHFTFAIVLHQFPGVIAQADGGWTSVNEQLGTLTWDATGTSTPPTMRGNPDGDLTFTGTMDLPVDARLTQWWFASVHAVGQLDNGDQVGVQPQFPIWLTQTMTAGGTIVGEALPLLNARVTTFDAATGIAYSNVVAEWEGYIPLAPISTPWFIPTAAYSYNTANLPAALTEVRRDLDFHHGIQGTTVLSATTLQIPGNNFATMGFAFDPRGLSPGPHKWALIRQQPDNADQTTALLVVTVTVDPTAPPSPPGPVLPPVVPPVVTPPPPPPPPTPVNKTCVASATERDGVITATVKCS